MADTYVNITWTLQTPAGFIDSFIVSYRTISSQTWTLATSSLLNYTRSYLLTGLSPSTTYVVGVATKNPLPLPSNYTTTTFTTAGGMTIYGMLWSYQPLPPIAVPYQTGPSGTIYAGIPFNLTCNLQAGYPGVMTWYRAGASLPSSAAIKGNTLVFTNPQPTDGGTYTCAYVNSSARSLPLTIAIMTCERTLGCCHLIYPPLLPLFPLPSSSPPSSPLPSRLLSLQSLHQSQALGALPPPLSLVVHPSHLCAMLAQGTPLVWCGQGSATPYPQVPWLMVAL